LSETNTDLSPFETAHRIHNLLLKVSTTADMFVTAFYAVLNCVTRQMRYIRGGHDWPVYYHAETGQTSLLNATGRFLGLLPNLIIEEKQLIFQAGDVLVCYSDGVTDAVRREDGELFGLRRLEEIVRSDGHRSAQELLQIIVNNIDRFRDGEEQPDDLTLLVTKSV
jgi:sigma-B regulation protein RsbU (phosphoserine phosphatase)